MPNAVAKLRSSTRRKAINTAMLLDLSKGVLQYGVQMSEKGLSVIVSAISRRQKVVSALRSGEARKYGTDRFVSSRPFSFLCLLSSQLTSTRRSAALSLRPSPLQTNNESAKRPKNMARERNEKSEQSMEQANENGTVAQTICTSTTAPFSEEASVDADTGAAGAAVVSAADDDDSSTAKLFPREEDREYVSLTDDVYTMFFLSNLFGPGFFYSAYVFALKMALYTFLALDVYKTGRPDMVDKTVLAAQFLML